MYSILFILYIYFIFDLSYTSERTRVVGYEFEERVCAICFDNVHSDIIFYNKGGNDAIVSTPNITTVPLFVVVVIFVFVNSPNNQDDNNNTSRWQLLIGRITNGKAREGEIISQIYIEGVPDTFVLICRNHFAM